MIILFNYDNRHRVRDVWRNSALTHEVQKLKPVTYQLAPRAPHTDMSSSNNHSPGTKFGLCNPQFFPLIWDQRLKGFRVLKSWSGECPTVYLTTEHWYQDLQTEQDTKLNTVGSAWDGNFQNPSEIGKFPKKIKTLTYLSFWPTFTYTRPKTGQFVPHLPIWPKLLKTRLKISLITFKTLFIIIFIVY